MTERKAFLLYILLILILFAFGFLLQVEAQEIVPEPHCPSYAPHCTLYLGEFDTPTVGFNPTPEPIDWSGEHIITIGRYRVFSNPFTLVLVDTETGDIALWLEVNEELVPSKEHLLLADNGLVRVWLLTTGEWQVEAIEGNVVKVMIFDGLPVQNPQYSER